MSLEDTATEESIVIYQATIASKNPNHWTRNICKECENKVILADDVGTAQDQFILCFSFFGTHK